MDYRDERYAAESVRSDLIGVADASGHPTITPAGVIQVGTVLTASLSGIRDSAGFDRDLATHEWLRYSLASSSEATSVQSSTTNTYTVAEADKDKFLAVRVSYLDYDTTHEEVTSARRAVAGGGIATDLPTIAGMAEVGSTLTASTDQVMDLNGLPDDVHKNLDWHVYSSTGVYDGGNRLKQGMAGSTKAANTTYTIGTDEVNERIVVLLRTAWTDADGNPNNQLVSLPTAEVQPNAANRPATGEVVIRGDPPAIGGTLRVDDTDISDPDGLPTTFSYTWYVDGRIVDDAIASIWIIETGREGQSVIVRVYFTDRGGVTESLYSRAIWVHEQPDATGAPVIVGEPQIGVTLSINLSGISDPRRVDTRSFSYQWRRRNDLQSNAQDIVGARAAQYELTPFDYGKLVGVAVDFRDRRGSPET